MSNQSQSHTFSVEVGCGKYYVKGSYEYTQCVQNGKKKT